MGIGVNWCCGNTLIVHLAARCRRYLTHSCSWETITILEKCLKLELLGHILQILTTTRCPWRKFLIELAEIWQISALCQFCPFPLYKIQYKLCNKIPKNAQSAQMCPRCPKMLKSDKSALGVPRCLEWSIVPTVPKSAKRSKKWPKVPQKTQPTVKKRPISAKSAQKCALCRVPEVAPLNLLTVGQ